MTRKRTLSALSARGRRDAAPQPGFVSVVQAVTRRRRIMDAHTGSFADFRQAGEVPKRRFKAGELARPHIPAGPRRPAGRGGPQGRPGLVGRPGHRPYPITRDTSALPPLLQLRCGHRHPRAKLDAGIRARVHPPDFSNGGFVFAFNEALKTWSPGPLNRRSMKALKNTGDPRHPDCSAVDYSKHLYK